MYSPNMTTPATPAQQAGGLQDIIERMSDRQAKARHMIMTVMTAGRELLKEGSVLESGQQSELQTKIFNEHLTVTSQCIRDGLDGRRATRRSRTAHINYK